MIPSALHAELSANPKFWNWIHTGHTEDESWKDAEPESAPSQPIQGYGPDAGLVQPVQSSTAPQGSYGPGMDAPLMQSSPQGYGPPSEGPQTSVQPGAIIGQSVGAATNATMQPPTSIDFNDPASIYAESERLRQERAALPLPTHTAPTLMQGLAGLAAAALGGRYAAGDIASGYGRGLTSELARQDQLSADRYANDARNLDAQSGSLMNMAGHVASLANSRAMKEQTLAFQQGRADDIKDARAQRLEQTKIQQAELNRRGIETAINSAKSYSAMKIGAMAYNAALDKQSALDGLDRSTQKLPTDDDSLLANWKQSSVFAGELEKSRTSVEKMIDRDLLRFGSITDQTAKAIKNQIKTDATRLQVSPDEIRTGELPTDQTLSADRLDERKDEFKDRLSFAKDVTKSKLAIAVANLDVNRDKLAVMKERADAYKGHLSNVEVARNIAMQQRAINSASKAVDDQIKTATADLKLQQAPIRAKINKGWTLTPDELAKFNSIQSQVDYLSGVSNSSPGGNAATLKNNQVKVQGDQADIENQLRSMGISLPPTGNVSGNIGGGPRPSAKPGASHKLPSGRTFSH